MFGALGPLREVLLPNIAPGLRGSAESIVRAVAARTCAAAGMRARSLVIDLVCLNGLCLCTFCV